MNGEQIRLERGSPGLLQSSIPAFSGQTEESYEEPG
jgi:hypothetical protein